jgi:protein gp37
MNRTNIEWCDYTLNPAVGCKHECHYCYAKKVHNRFWKDKSFTDIAFYPERLLEPEKVKKPSTIFIGSMSDPAFWNNEIWNQVMAMCRRSPRHTFMLLSKDPHNAYINKRDRRNIPENVMLGLTMDFSSNDDAMQFEKNVVMHALSYFAKVFVSIEPLLGPIRPLDFYFYQKVIIGAMTGRKAVVPKQLWLDSISRVPKELIFYKNNIKKHIENAETEK